MGKSESNKDFGVETGTISIPKNGPLIPVAGLMPKKIVTPYKANGIVTVGQQTIKHNGLNSASKVKMSFEKPIALTSAEYNSLISDPLSHSPSKTQVDWKIVQKTKLTSNQTFLEYYFQTMAGFSEGRTKTNQDSVYLNVEILSSHECSMFAVFDGHGTLGHKVSDFLKRHLTGMS